MEYSELYNEYEFQDNLSLKFFYLNNFKSVKETDDEFNDFFLKVFKSQKAPFEMPRFDLIQDEFLISKGLKQRKKILKEEKVKWDILYEEENNGHKYYLKCRFDEKNKVNVLIQNSFSLDFYNASEVALDCVKLFYSNEYPIIIIEDHNGGGYANLLILMHQVLLLRTTDRSYESFRISNISKEYFSTRNWNFVDVQTCKIGKFFNDTTEIIDHFNYNGLDIEHKRTRVIDRFPRNFREALKNIREEYFNSSYLKKPTDVIIFTDSFSYSSTSGFIKGFQSTGGAIVVGYYGNPTKNGTDFFDSSQSDSDVQNLGNSQIYQNLNDLGITVIGVTCGESYDDFYQKDNPIPREYTLEPVDYRVDIYSRYSDDIYEKFIKEGLEVHKLFNNGSYCNAKNDKLLLHNESCYTIKDDEHAHGGFKCNDEGKWDTQNCFGYYCDIGYYYEHFENKCKEECPYDENRKYYFIYEKDLYKTYNIIPGMTYQFQLLNRENYYYSFELGERGMNNRPNLLILKGLQGLTVPNNNDNNSLPIKIKPINQNINSNITFHLYSVQNYNIVGKFFVIWKAYVFFPTFS